MRDLLRVGCSFERAGLALLLEKPVFDTLTPIGSCRPDFLLEARSRSTGETREIIVEAMGSTDETYLAAKAVTQPRIDRKSVVKGKSVSVRVDLGGRRFIKKKNKKSKWNCPMQTKK